MLTAQQKDTLRNIGSGGKPAFPVFMRPEKLACNDMAFGRPRRCKCHACVVARRVAAAGKERFGTNMPYQFFPIGKRKKAIS